MSTRMAGRKWLKMFLSRNPSVSKRKPQLMNPARAQKMNKPIVKHHFGEVKKLYEELLLHIQNVCTTWMKKGVALRSTNKM